MNRNQKMGDLKLGESIFDKAHYPMEINRLAKGIRERSLVCWTIGLSAEILVGVLAGFTWNFQVGR